MNTPQKNLERRFRVSLDVVVEHCILIKNGVRPLFFHPIKIRDKAKIERAIKSFSSLNFFFEDCASGWETVYVFKNPRLEKLLKSLPNKPATEADHALLGFLCGYSVDSICDYLELNEVPY